MANAGGPYTGTAGAAVSFNGATSSDPQGQTLTYAWNFGDNSTGSGVSPTHTYAAAGTYTISLTVTDTSNLTGTATSKATIAVAPLPGAGMTGLVYEGKNPIAGAHVYLLAANITGYGAASTSLLSAAETGTSDSVGAYVATGSNGGFSLTGDYSCATGQQLYLYVLGGNSGPGTNSAAGLLAAIGSCPSSSGPAISAIVNEVTTVAAAYAIAGFATDATHVSSSGTALAQVGVANAFANAANLASLSTGTALATTPAGNGSVPQAEINTLANILAACAGSGGPTSTSCSTLFSNAKSAGSTGTTATDTATAAINIAHYPGNAIASLYGLTAGTPPFGPGLSTQPNDFTMAISFAGNGVSSPLGIAIDGTGNAWIANGASNNVLEMSSSGVLRSGTAGFIGGGLSAPSQVAIDPTGNAWFTSSSMHSVVEISSAGNFLSGSSGFSGLNSLGNNSLVGPSGIAIDGSGNVWVPNAYGNFGVSEFTNSGSFIGWINGLGVSMSLPEGVAVDPSGTAWIANLGDGLISAFSTAANFGSGNSFPVGPGLTDPLAVAIDGSSNVWITNLNGVAKLSSSGAYYGYSGGGLGDPECIAIDGAGNVWVGSGNRTLVELSNSGAVLSGSSGYRSGDQVSIFSVAVDGSGNLWTSNSGVFVEEIIGAAVPAVTPLSVGVKNNALGTRP